MSSRERLKEIRLCWREDVTHGQEYQLRNRSQWVLETAGSRRDIGTICHAANEVYGEGTHWIEQRDGVPLPQPPLLYSAPIPQAPTST